MMCPIVFGSQFQHSPFNVAFQLYLGPQKMLIVTVAFQLCAGPQKMLTVNVALKACSMLRPQTMLTFNAAFF